MYEGLIALALSGSKEGKSCYAANQCVERSASEVAGSMLAWKVRRAGKEAVIDALFDFSTSSGSREWHNSIIYRFKVIRPKPW